MRKAPLAVVIGFLLITAACSRGGAHVVAPVDLPREIYPEGKKAPREVDRNVVLYFYKGGRLEPVLRSGQSKLTEADLALRSLMCGPTAEEREAGLASALPAPSSLNGVTLKGSVARVDFDENFSGGSPDAVVRRVAQVVFTMSEVGGVRSVAFYVNRKPFDVPDQTGQSRSGGVAKARYSSLGPRTSLASPAFEGALPLTPRLDCR